jgi:hypothetical protein
METTIYSVRQLRKSVSDVIDALNVTGLHIIPDDETLAQNAERIDKLKTLLMTVLGNYATDAAGLNIDIGIPIIKEVYAQQTWRPMDQDDAKAMLEKLQSNRLLAIIWSAYNRAVSTADAQHPYDIPLYQSAGFQRLQTNQSQPRVTMNVDNEDGTTTTAVHYKLMWALEILRDAEITKNDITHAVAVYNEYVDYYTRNANPRKSGSNFGKVVLNIRGTEGVNGATIREEIKELELPKSNWLAGRTWGFEIEVPDAKGVEVTPGTGIEKGEDGSLRSFESSDDCECDCDDCTYHECDCDYCESQNDSPDHCGNSYCAQCDSAEYRSTGGIVKGKHAAMIKLCEELEANGAEINDTAGVHIHVYARDLNMQQVGQVVATYAVIENVLTHIAGRRGVGYAQVIPAETVAGAISSKNPKLSDAKPFAVNLMHLKNDRGTIEFRQMEGNIDWQRITKWAAIVRGIVTVAKRGAKFHDYKNITTLQGILDVFKKFDYEIGNENPDEVIYGSRADKPLTTVNQYAWL